MQHLHTVFIVGLSPTSATINKIATKIEVDLKYPLCYNNGIVQYTFINNLATNCPGGGIGRHAGLRSQCESVTVRVRPGAPY